MTMESNAESEKLLETPSSLGSDSSTDQYIKDVLQHRTQRKLYGYRITCICLAALLALLNLGWFW